MIGELCAKVRNYFLGSDPAKNIHSGEYTISGGKLAPLDFLKTGQYFRIVGSTLNDGVYRYPATALVDETFAGSVWAMEVTPSFIALADEIEAYINSKDGKASPYISESIADAGYSYTKAVNSNGTPVSWEDVFAARLNQYRRMRVL